MTAATDELMIRATFMFITPRSSRVERATQRGFTDNAEASDELRRDADAARAR